MIRVLISTGDPAGIGPEISIKAVSQLLDEGVKFVPILVIDEPVISRIKKFFNVEKKITRWTEDKTGEIFFVETGVIKNTEFPSGINHHLTGMASFKYFEKAWQLLSNQYADCLVTAPISKTAWKLAGIHYSGHTDALSSFSGEKTYMLMSTKNLKVLLATVHIPMRDIWKHLTVEHLFLSTKITSEFITKFFKIKNMSIGFCGLNPHAGESGTMGDEENNIIIPAMEKLRQNGFSVSGPFPADAIFRKNISDKDFDLIVSLYHDQAMIVLKTMFFEELVNITVNASGWIRTSPGHGTAFDIAWTGKADVLPMKEAILTAIKMAKNN